VCTSSSTVRIDNAPKIRFSATLGEEPEVEVALVSGGKLWNARAGRLCAAVSASTTFATTPSGFTTNPDLELVDPL
jgi:hypothetical protein